MTLKNERVIRAGFAAVVSAVVAIIVVSGNHPCDGTGRLLLFPPIVAAIALVATLPNPSARALLLPGAVATTVLAVAMGLDYTSSSAVGPGGLQCEPVQGFAGFLLAALFSTVMAGLGLLGTALVLWLGDEAMRWRSGRTA